MKTHEFISVSDAAFVTTARDTTRCLNLHRFTIFFEFREDFLAVMDLQDSVYVWEGVCFGPTRFEDDLHYVVTRVGSDKLRYSVVCGLVIFEKVRFLENLAARSAWEDVVTEREEEIVIGGDV